MDISFHRCVKIEITNPRDVSDKASEHETWVRNIRLYDRDGRTSELTIFAENSADELVLVERIKD